jgi:prepilin-type N-terminal cleavage/methylation domain-containing protein
VRRGLTLIEVVAATALLTLIVAASVPILGAARRDLAASRAVPDGAAAESFEDAVDDLLLQQRGLAAELPEHPAGLELRWQSNGQEFEATATMLTAARAADDKRRSSHCWVRFRAGEAEAVRWLLLPDLPEGGRP